MSSYKDDPDYDQTPEHDIPDCECADPSPLRCGRCSWCYGYVYDAEPDQVTRFQANEARS